MTVVNPKSISGINSITMASGSDNLLTIHSNNTTERVRVDSSGNLTATSFSGDGSSLTGVASTENIRTNTNATFLQNVNVSGTSTIGGDVNIADKIVHIGDTNTAIRFPAADTISAETGGSERARIDSSGRLMLGTTTEGFAGADELTIATSGSTGITIRSGTSNDGNIYFSDGDDGSSAEYQGYVQYEHAHGRINFGTEASTRVKIDGANLNISNGNLKFETSGTGIDFSATDNATGTSSSELFDDYEEGTWVPDARDGNLSYSDANYTKIGRMVYVSGYVHSFTDTSTNDQVTIQGLPFTIGVAGVGGGSVMYQYVSQAHATCVYISSTGLKFYGGSTSNYDGVRYNELSGSHSFYFHAWYIN